MKYKKWDRVRIRVAGKHHGKEGIVSEVVEWVFAEERCYIVSLEEGGIDLVCDDQDLEPAD